MSKKVSYIILTCNRKQELIECIRSIKKQTYRDIEIIVVDNGSKEDMTKLVKNQSKKTIAVRLNKNTGVCKGRNIGIKKARGDILIFIDDDEIINDKDATKKIVNRFKEDKSIGVLTFKVVNYYDKKVESRTIPSTDKSLVNKEFETSYFLGGANATRREVFRKCGLLEEDYFYGMEELDLSYRIMKSDYKIIYYPKIEFIHKHSLRQRKAWQHIYYPFRNRLWMITKYLPLRYKLSHTIIWGLYYLQLSIRQGYFKYFLKAIYDASKGMDKMRKKREKVHLNSQDIKRIKQLKGRLLY